MCWLVEYQNKIVTEFSQNEDSVLFNFEYLDQWDNIVDNLKTYYKQHMFDNYYLAAILSGCFPGICG